MSSLSFLKDVSRINAVKNMISGDTQLHSPRGKEQEGVPKKNTLYKLLLELVDDCKLDSSDKSIAEDFNELSFKAFTPSRRANLRFEDFRPDSNGVGSWFTIKLVSNINERTLFFSLIKKFVLTGISIREVLTFETLVERKWKELLPEEQVTLAILIMSMLASVKQSKSLYSPGLPLIRLVKRFIKTSRSLTEIRLARFALLISDLLIDLNKYEKAKKLTFDEFKSKKKTFPEKKHIGVSNSQDGSKSGSGEVLDPALLPEYISIDLIKDEESTSKIFELALSIISLQWLSRKE